MRAEYVGNCVTWPYSADLLDEIIDSPEITRRTFLKHIDREHLAILEKEMGYTKYFHIANEYHVTYHKLVRENKIYYTIQQSGIEYVYMKERC